MAPKYIFSPAESLGRSTLTIAMVKLEEVENKLVF
jgi:hypothetical protein